MKLCVSTYSLWQWRHAHKKSVEDSFDWIADQGIKAVEVSAVDGEFAQDPRKRSEQLRKHADKRGLVIPSLCVGAELLLPAEAQRKTIDQLKVFVDCAHIFGATSMRHDVTRGFGKHSEGVPGAPTFGNALKVVVPAIREVADYAQPKKVKTSLENHGFYMQASVRVEKLIKAVNHKNYGLTIDMGNFLCVNENPVKAVARLAKYAVMAHTKDFHVKKKAVRPATGWFDTPTAIALRGAIVGHGVIDVPAELALLKKAGYKGYLSLEFEGMEEPTMAIKAGLDFLTTHLEAIKALD